MNAAAMEVLLSKGLTGEDLLEVARALEADRPQSAAAKRQARYRERKQESVTGDVTGNVTPPLKENSKPNSVSDETGGKPPDPAKQLFDLGIEVLTGAGETESKARSMVGKWRKDYGLGKTLEALLDCRAKAISSPVEWMTKRLGAAEPSVIDMAEASARRREIYEQSQSAGAHA